MLRVKAYTHRTRSFNCSTEASIQLRSFYQLTTQKKIYRFLERGDERQPRCGKTKLPASLKDCSRRIKGGLVLMVFLKF